MMVIAGQEKNARAINARAPLGLHDITRAVHLGRSYQKFDREGGSEADVFSFMSWDFEEGPLAACTWTQDWVFQDEEDLAAYVSGLTFTEELVTGSETQGAENASAGHGSGLDSDATSSSSLRQPQAVIGLHFTTLLNIGYVFWDLERLHAMGLFQYVCPSTSLDSETATDHVVAGDISIVEQTIYSALKDWLAQTLEGEMPGAMSPSATYYKEKFEEIEARLKKRYADEGRELQLLPLPSITGRGGTAGSQPPQSSV
jgi:hypothetical protein